MLIRHGRRWISTTLILAGVPLLACSGPVSSTAPEATGIAQVTHVEGAELAGLMLSERAMQRIDVEIAPVRRELVPLPSRGEGFSGLVARKIVPYSALIYDAQGTAWVYTNPAPRTFVRQRVAVYGITGDRALLLKGPETGSEVVSLGAAEIYGTELALRD